MNLPNFFRKSTTAGFSLVEVSISIAVAGISIFAVVGLMPTLLDYDQKSGANSVIPTLATQAAAAIKKERALNSGALTLTPADIYFTQEGAVVPLDHPEAIYKCVSKLQRVSDAATNATGLSVPDPGDHCLYATMTFTWPVGTPANPQRTRIIQATVTDN